MKHLQFCFAAKKSWVQNPVRTVPVFSLDVLSGYVGFLPQFKDIHVRKTDIPDHSLVWVCDWIIVLLCDGLVTFLPVETGTNQTVTLQELSKYEKWIDR